MNRVLLAIDEWDALSNDLKNTAKQNKKIEDMVYCFNKIKGFLSEYLQGEKKYRTFTIVFPPYKDKTSLNVPDDVRKIYEKVASVKFRRLFDEIEHFVPLVYEWKEISKSIQGLSRDEKRDTLESAFVYRIEQLKQILDDYCAKHPELAANAIAGHKGTAE